MKDGTATVVLLDKDAGNIYGMYRTILANMVEGVTDGFLRTLEIVGVGYKAESKGGRFIWRWYSHPVVFPLPPGVTALVESNTVISFERVRQGTRSGKRPPASGCSGSRTFTRTRESATAANG